MTKYPPTTFIDAKKTAAVPRAMVISSEDPEDKMAPTKVIPDMAFAPDMRGVCSVEGTLVISSTPRNIERTNMNTKRII